MPSSLLSIFGLVLNAAGALIMLKWPISANSISFDKNDKQWKESGTWVNSLVVPGWKVVLAHLGPGLLFLGFLPQIVAYCLR
jgi:hypothetical protein